MSLRWFLNTLRRIGFELIKYYADYDRKESGIPLNEALVNNPIADDFYSACWYGGEFFNWLISDMHHPTDVFYPNRMISGEYTNNIECHYFFVLTTNDTFYLFNTYGGVSELIFVELPLDRANWLLKQVKYNDRSALKELFGVYPSYKSFTDSQFNLHDRPLDIPPPDYLRSKIDELIDRAHHPLDAQHLMNLRVLV